jgi:predicted acyl esterase
MTQEPFPIRSEVLHVPMDDGVKLSVHVHRPDLEGEFPALLDYTPYRKGPLHHHRPPTDDYRAVGERGYATVTFDIRGTGNSEGWNDCLYSERERQDAYDMIEWAAAQPWCNGRVGMWGKSYGAVVSLQMAAAAPPSLKAIVARSGTDDIYTEWTNPGGSPRPYIYNCYAPVMAASNFSPPDPVEVGERWADMWAERLERNVPWGICFIENLLDGPFWRERSLRGRYDAVECAVFVIGGWADWYASPLLRTFSKLEGPKRGLIGPWSHQYPDEGIPGPRIDWLGEALKWFDCWLKGIDNGVIDEPPLTLFVREGAEPATIRMEEPGFFRWEHEWPLARREETAFYLRAGGRLDRQPPLETSDGAQDTIEHDPRVGTHAGMHGGGPFGVNWAMPLDQRVDEVHSLVYTADPLDESVEVTGVSRAVLHVSSTAPVSILSVKLCDVAPDGTSSLVTRGYLNLGHRESHSSPSPVEPGEPYDVVIELLPCAYRFKAGHRIRLDVATADFMNVWSTPYSCANTVFRTEDRPSHVILPVVPRRESPLPQPDLSPSTDPPPRREDLATPEFSIQHDIIRETVEACFETSQAPGWINSGGIRVSEADPACIVAHGESRRIHRYPGRDIVVNAQCVTSSDEEAFHHTVQVAVTVNDKSYFTKKWMVSVPRELM